MRAPNQYWQFALHYQPVGEQLANCSHVRNLFLNVSRKSVLNLENLVRVTAARLCSTGVRFFLSISDEMKRKAGGLRCKASKLLSLRNAQTIEPTTAWSARSFPRAA